MAINLRRKIFLVVFCLASITQGMYSTYFVSILTTIERVYQIQSKTAGAILSATEIGQILGSLLIAHYGGRGNKPRWIAACMTLSALAALISISPHLLTYTTFSNNLFDRMIHNQKTELTPSPTFHTASDLISNTTSINSLIAPSTQISRELELPGLDELCFTANLNEPIVSNLTANSVNELIASESARRETSSQSYGIQLMVFFVCLLAIGFGSTAIATLGITFIDDIVSREDSPLYLGLTIGLRVFGPALGFLLGSYCINIKLTPNSFGDSQPTSSHIETNTGAWWLGLIIISIPLLMLALPMYYLSRIIDSGDDSIDDYGEITYQAAEDHDIGGSHDFQPHMLRLSGVDCDLGELSPNRTSFSSDTSSSSSGEVLRLDEPTKQQVGSYESNYRRNLANINQSVLTHEIQESKYTEPINVDLSNDHNNDGPIASRSSNNLIHIFKANNNDNDNGNETISTANWRSNICVVVNHFGGLERSNFTNNDEAIIRLNEPRARSSTSSSSAASSSSSRSFIVSSIVPPSHDKSNDIKRSQLLSQQQQLQQAQSQPQQQQSLIQQATIADLSSALSRLIKNRLLLLRMFSGILHILPIAGFFTFFPKYLNEQFRITMSTASAISGLAGILFVGLGAFLGGTIVRLFNVNSRLMTRWIATSALLYGLGMIILMNLGCGTNQTIHYESAQFLATDCSASCKCSSSIYNPVCANGTTYISPCLAGCRNFTISGEKIIYEECGCSLARALLSPPLSPQTNENFNLSYSQQPADQLAPSGQLNDHVNLNIASSGHCLVDCDNIKWYLIIFSMATLIHASCEVGSMMFNLRCVSSGDRTMALGLTTFSSSLLGTIPCSVIYGTIVDLTCVHWDSLGSGPGPDSLSKGACRAYENDSFRYYLHGLTASVMLLAFLVDCVISRHAHEVDFYNRHDSRTDIRIELKKSTETI